MEASEPTKGEQTREESLSATNRLFLSQGYTATTMRQIAQAVGISPAAIYNHFSGKDDIFTTLLQAAAPYDALFAMLRKFEADTPEAMVRGLFRNAIQLLSDQRDYIRLVLIGSQEREGASLITVLPQVLPPARDLYQRLVAIDAAHGQLRAIPFGVFVRALVSLIPGYLITEGVFGAPGLLQPPEVDWAQELGAIFMRGVLNPSGSRKD